MTTAVYGSSFFFSDTATTEIYTLSLHDALPIFGGEQLRRQRLRELAEQRGLRLGEAHRLERAARVQLQPRAGGVRQRSEEHTSELQSQFHLVCRLLLEKKKRPTARYRVSITECH